MISEEPERDRFEIGGPGMLDPGSSSGSDPTLRNALLVDVRGPVAVAVVGIGMEMN